jgi:hypothetical protein
VHRASFARDRHGPFADRRRFNANAPAASATTSAPPTSTPTGDPEPRPWSPFTRAIATCELDDELDVAPAAVVTGTVIVVTVDGDSLAIGAAGAVVVGAATATGPASGTVGGAVAVVVVDATHVDAGSALQFGCGSLGFALPSGVQRQPSAIDALTRVDGPVLEYVHPLAAVPCQYDQYA